MVKAILLDIDDTLFPSTEFSEKARKHAVQAMVREGLDAEPDAVYALLGKIVEARGSNYPKHFDALLEKLGVEKDPRIVAAAVGAYHNAKGTIAPFPDVPKTLVQLRDRGFRLYAVSEGNSVKQWDKLIRLGLQFFFHGAFISEDVGCEKNDRFYAIVLKKLGLPAKEVLMVGDRVDKDIAPAKKAGMRTARIFHGKYSKQTGTKADFEIARIGDLLKVV